MGELMLESHRSYSAVGLGNEFTDELVQMVCEAGAAKGVFGARVSGGGNGGTVCILNFGEKGKATVKEIYRQYKQKMKRRLFLFNGSSHGAWILNQT
jgi:L-arabinokinase